ncbi:MAG: STAS domain-containing protein [Edaphobacter sp.]
MSESAPPAAPTRYLTLEIERNGDLATVRCYGQLVSGLTETLSSRVKPLIPESKKIVLDLCHLSYMDSMGLGTLISLYTSARTAGCGIELLNIGKRVRELLGLTNLLGVFGIIGEHGVRL